MPISPGVYTKIFDLSTYVEAVPSTVSFLAILSRKGEDNVMKFVSSRSEFVSEFGEPNILDFGTSYSQGPYVAYNYLGESGALYVLRVLPNDATYSNLRINLTENTSTDYTVSTDSISGLNTKSEIDTNLVYDGTSGVIPLCIFYPIGRGDAYNAVGIRLTPHANPLVYGVYTLDIYERQSDGDEVISESFEVSFDKEAIDSSGSSLFIEDVLNTYSTFLRCKVGDAGYETIGKIYAKDMSPDVSVVLTQNSASITDPKQDFSLWESQETGHATYMVICKDSRGNTIWGWLGESASNGTTVHVFSTKNLSSGTRGWSGDTTNFDTTSGGITYQVKKSLASISSAFVSATPVPLRKGSLGSLLNSNGTVNTTVATQLLSQAYLGAIDPSVLDTENYYFNVIWDAGYPTEVKTQIAALAKTRRDCIALLDNGDNSSYTTSIQKRSNEHTFNSFYVALYEEYNKVYDPFIGRDVWFSPLYHISYLLPRNDLVAEVWYPIAGFNRASIDSIKELRFNPSLAQRDQMYLKRLNPIVKFLEGYVVWGQLTSQIKASALTDINIVRLVLYCKRALERYCRNFIFELNDVITWNQVKADIVDFLEDIKKRRGLYDFSVEVGATEYERKRKQFHVNVILEPTRAVEQINLNFFIK